MRAISTTSRRELSSSFFFLFPARQDAEGNSRHSDRNINGTCTILYHRQKLGGQFKCGDFSTCDAPRPGRHKTVTTPEIIEKIHELILGDRRISAKSIAEQLGISRERVGSIIHGDLNMRKLSAKWVPKCPNADQKHQWCQSSEQHLAFFRRDPNDSLSWLVTMDETWLYFYDPETKQQSMKWRYSGSTPSKKFWVKKSAGKVLAKFFEIKKHPPHWLSSKGPNYQRGVLLISAGAIEGHFERRTLRKFRQGGLVLALQCPGSPGTCNPEETGLPGLPVSWSPTLFFGSGPVGLSPVPWTEKTIKSSPLFLRRGGHCCLGDLVRRTNFWIFLWVACKS